MDIYDVRKIFLFFLPPPVTVTNQLIVFRSSAFWGPHLPPPTADVIYGSPLRVKRRGDGAGLEGGGRRAGWMVLGCQTPMGMGSADEEDDASEESTATHARAQAQASQAQAPSFLPSSLLQYTHFPGLKSQRPRHLAARRRMCTASRPTKGGNRRIRCPFLKHDSRILIQSCNPVYTGLFIRSATRIC